MKIGQTVCGSCFKEASCCRCNVEEEWISVGRPGYFGKQRDYIIKSLNEAYGVGNWKLEWRVGKDWLDFLAACKLYELSYLNYFSNHQQELDFVCSHYECIDNNLTNIASGFDYNIQEANSTHIQDIAVRNVLRLLGREFESDDPNKILVIRSQDSNGWRYNPGQIAFINPELIIQPSFAPKWAKKDSVEDFWQSNKFIRRRGIL